MIMRRWHVRFTPTELPSLTAPLPFVAEVPQDWGDWLRRADVVPGTLFLLSPSYEYDDVVLSGFFQSMDMLASAAVMQAGYARDLAAFLTLLWSARRPRLVVAAGSRRRRAGSGAGPDAAHRRRR
jgi:hypothetical protein